MWNLGFQELKLQHNCDSDIASLMSTTAFYFLPRAYILHACCLSYLGFSGGMYYALFMTATAHISAVLTLEAKVYMQREGAGFWGPHFSQFINNYRVI